LNAVLSVGCEGDWAKYVMHVVIKNIGGAVIRELKLPHAEYVSLQSIKGEVVKAQSIGPSDPIILQSSQSGSVEKILPEMGLYS
jgi:hypothetical protein